MGRLIVAILGRLSYIGIGVLLGMLFVVNAYSATFRGEMLVCQRLGQIVSNVADLRDAGVPWATFEPWMQANVDAGLADPDSFVKDAEDAAFIMRWVKRVYDTPGATGQALAKEVTTDCMRKPVTTRRIML